MVANPDYPYAEVSVPHICIDNEGRKTAWIEKRWGADEDMVLERQGFFQRPKYSRGYKLPLIIWAHPTGQNAVPKGDIYKAVGETALKNGFAFLSVEYRHPTASRPYPGLPPEGPPDQDQNGGTYPPFCALDSTDIAATIQWAKRFATRLQVDRDNIFVVGQSRGSLGLLTAYMPNQKDPSRDPKLDYRGHSSKPNAVFMAQAQVTYLPSQLRQTFLRRNATQQESHGGDGQGPGIFDKDLQFPLCKTGSPAVYDYHCHWEKADQVINPRSSNLLSALDQYDATDPPAWLRYERMPPSKTAVVKTAGYVPDAGRDPAKMGDPEDCYDRSGHGCLDAHHPNFGVELRRRSALSAATNVVVQYADTGRIPAQEATAVANFYRDYYCFFIKYKPQGFSDYISNITASGETQRIDAIKSYIANRKDGDPPAGQPASCGLDEALGWDWR